MLVAQNTTVSLWEENLEQLSMDGEERNWEDELEELSRRLQEPININVATKRQLEEFPFLTAFQIEHLLAYVYVHGQMQTVYELQLVEGMDKRTIELLLPFICIKSVENKSGYPSLKKILKYGKQEILTRMDVPLYARKGYDKNYLGPAVYHSLKYDFRYGDYLQMGIVGEKDAGEPLFALQNKKGYDYYSFYCLLKTSGRLKSLALGNYKLSFGQGLVLSTDFRLGKTFSMSTSEYRTGGIRKHSSTDEYNYFRGVAATMELLRCLELSVFYSHRSMDGVVKNGDLTYEKNKLKIGVTGIYYFFNHPYEPDLKKYAKYNLHGNNFYNLGVDYKYRLGKLVWVGEGAVGKQGYALLNQLKYRLLTSYQLLLIHRYYSHDYCSFFSHSFGESGTPQNENGWYLAAEATPLEHWKFFASLDLFSFPGGNIGSANLHKVWTGCFRPLILLVETYRYILITGIGKRRGMCRKQAGKSPYLSIITSSVAGLLICRKVLCAVLRSITTIFASKMGKGMNSRENKVGSVASLVLIHFPDFLWLYLCKALTFIRTITTPGFTLLKKACFIHFTPLLFMAEGFVILLMYVMT